MKKAKVTKKALPANATITEQMLKELGWGLRRDEHSQATITKYLRDARQFALWLGPELLTREAVANWRESLVFAGWKPSTVNGKLAAVNALLRSLGREDCKARFVRVQRRVFRDVGRDLSHAEYVLLVRAAYEHGRERTALVMETICASGIRVSELKAITVEAVEAGQATVRCKGKQRVVLLPEALCEKLADYVRRHGIESGSVFVTRTGKPLSRRQVWGEMKALCAVAGVQPSKVFPHNLRHLFAVEYYRTDRDIVRLADLMGHSSIETTRIYLFETGDEHRRRLDDMRLVLDPMQYSIAVCG